MRIHITPQHIRTARDTQGRLSPLELAVLDQDCFEEVTLQGLAEGQPRLVIDGESIKLPAKIKRSLKGWQESQTMDPLSFELPLESQALAFEEFSMDLFEDFGL